MVKKAKGKKVVESKGGAGGASAGSGSLFKKNAKNFRLGGDIQPKRDLTRFVKWPRYIRIQRQKRILMQRLKVPPTINQFSQTLEKNQTAKLLKLLAKYTPETHKEKSDRLKTEAEGKAGGKDAKKTEKPMHLKFGLNHVTTLVEENKAKMVVIAHDVDPIELVVHLPALCRKKGVPFCFVRGKANLGKLVHLKTATCVALTEVRREDFVDLEQLGTLFKTQFNDNANLTRKWGGGIMGVKNQHMMAARRKLMEIELAKKAMV
jgi:large subunit ribosomal protein L7Ae